MSERTKLVLLVLGMAAIVAAVMLLPGDGWSTVPSSEPASREPVCEIPHPAGDGSPIDPALWQEAKDLTGIDRQDAPKVMYDKFPACSELSGYYFKDRNLIVLDEPVRTMSDLQRGYFVIHEAVHALLVVKYPITLHHCLMLTENYSDKELKWLAAHYQQTLPEVIYGLSRAALIDECLATVPELVKKLVGGNVR